MSLIGFRGFCADVASGESQTISRITRAIAEVQGTLMNYLHGTRGIDIPDSEHMSRHSFLSKLLKKVEDEENIGRAMSSRFFRYHPINEFEAFFESIRLKPSEIISFLRQDLMFLSDDEELTESYHVLCNYGIARGNIGKMYNEAAEVFRCDFGNLESKVLRLRGIGP